MKKTLSQTNPYIKDSALRKRMLRGNAYESSVFEGAQGLKDDPHHPSSPKRRSKASRKKSARA